MTDNATITVDDAEVLARLQTLLQRMSDPAPALSEIGEALKDSTQYRFDTGTAPDGSRWAPNSEMTLFAYLGARGGFRKGGGLNKKGVALAGNKKPLVASGIMQDTITWQPGPDGRSIEIGSNRIQAKMLHYGGITAASSMIPSKIIPARPFLGFSDDDNRTILDIIGHYVAQNYSA
jgi:phage gpG-like protein